MTAPLLALEVASVEQYLELDQRVDGAEKDAIWARWEFGRLLLAERNAHGGKQLPHGRIDELCVAVRKKPQEIRRRMRFAEEYDAPEKVIHAWTTFGSWHEVCEFLETSVLQSSKSEDWYTPAKYVEAARRVLGAIDLDPASCAEANETVGATRFYTREDDGLAHPWQGRVFLNPPYAGAAPLFIEKLCAEYSAGAIEAAIAILNTTALGTHWFQVVWDTALICATDHHLQFNPGPGNTASGSAHGGIFAYFGPDPDRFHLEFEAFGAIVMRRPRP